MIDIRIKVSILVIGLIPCLVVAQKPVPQKPRILISTDIGGTDPDDNQSMIHFLMYSDLFETEGLVSSPSYGNGSKNNLFEMIDLYERDLTKLQAHDRKFPSPGTLRALCKQGRKGVAPYSGYSTPTEGSDWIIHCAQKKSSKPLWVLVWGGLDDLAQALHDAPVIASKIRVYWIGGPNKKWSVNSYAYIVQNFPSLWFIENNATYHGLFSNLDLPNAKDRFYERSIQERGAMGKAFKIYYGGQVKMGDTPSLLYMMDGNPEKPMRENWGGSFEKYKRSSRRVFQRNTSVADTVPVYSVVEFHFKGPEINLSTDSACFSMRVKAKIGEQTWPGYYLGKGEYAIRYSPKQAETLNYQITSSIPGFITQTGQFVVSNNWPGAATANDYPVEPNWYSDLLDPQQFYGEKQGAQTVLRWREEALRDWSKRWLWLK